MLLLYVEIVNIFVLNSETNIFQNIKLFNIITVQDLLTVSVEDIKNFKGIGKNLFKKYYQR